MRGNMERAWRAIPLAVAIFALAFIGWMIRMLQLAWVRDACRQLQCFIGPVRGQIPSDFG